MLTAAASASPPLRPRTWRVLAAVLSLTSTWTRLEDHVPHGQIAQAAGLDKPSDRRAVARELRELADRGLIVYRPGTSRPGEPRTSSVVGLPQPPVDMDPRSGAEDGHVPTPGRHRPAVGTDRRSETATTPGRSGARPPVGTDPPSLHTPTDPSSETGAADPEPSPVPDLWGGVVGRLPARSRRRIEASPRRSRTSLHRALDEAATAGVSPGQLRKMWDEPTALDAAGVEDPAAVLASRIRRHLEAGVRGAA